VEDVMNFLPWIWRVDFELNAMSRYLDYLESSLDEERVRLRDKFEEFKGRTSSKQAFAKYESEILDFRTEFPHYLYFGFVSTWYSFVEFYLLKLCEERDLCIKITAFDNPYSKGIRRAKDLLREAEDYTIPNEDWQELSHIKKIRNKLVHNLGRIETRRTEPEGDAHYEEKSIKGNTFYLRIEENLFNYLEEHDLLESGGPDFVISPHYEFSSYLVDFAREIFHTISDDLQLTS
jgi:hypothetical protein